MQLVARHGDGATLLLLAQQLKDDQHWGRNTGIDAEMCCHPFRATEITAYLDNNGTLENAQTMAVYESLRTTKLYDRTSDEITLGEVERIAI
jgi:hypothetical protein